MILGEIDLDALRKATDEYKAAWDAAAVRHNAMVAEAAIEKRALPDNYWQPAHAAALKYTVAKALLEAFE